jgi:hypothetical protein
MNVLELCAAISDDFENYHFLKTSLWLFSPLLTIFSETRHSGLSFDIGLTPESS